MSNHEAEHEMMMARIPAARKLIRQTRQGAVSSPDWQKLQEPVRLMLERGLDFGEDTLQAIMSHLADDYVPQAQILTRAFFELGARLLWASRTKDGWRRLQATVAQDDLDWAKKAQDFPELAPEAKLKVSSAEIKSRTGEARKLPDVRQMLENIDALDAENGLKVGDRFGTFLYLAVYGVFSGPTHGHMIAIKRQRATDQSKKITAAAVHACAMTVRAVYQAAGWNIEPPMQEIQKILRPDGPPGSQ